MVLAVAWWVSSDISILTRKQLTREGSWKSNYLPDQQFPQNLIILMGSCRNSPLTSCSQAAGSRLVEHDDAPLRSMLGCRLPIDSALDQGLLLFQYPPLIFADVPIVFGQLISAIRIFPLRPRTRQRVGS